MGPEIVSAESLQEARVYSNRLAYEESDEEISEEKIKKAFVLPNQEGSSTREAPITKRASCNAAAKVQKKIQRRGKYSRVN